MNYFEDSDLIVQKALATKIVNTSKPTCLKLSKICEKTAQELNALENSLEKAKDVQEIAVGSKRVKELQVKLVLAMSLKDRVDMLINRNLGRMEYLSDKLEMAGIYNERYDKKAFNDLESAELDNVSEENLNLNKAQNGNQTMKFVLGETLVFVDGKLDFTVEHNKQVLMSVDSDFLTKIVASYPSSVSTIPNEMLLNIPVKQNILKAVTTYVSEGVKTKSIKDINRELGGLLSFKTEITSNVTDYVAGVQNMFDVTCKALLIEKFPQKAKQIKEKLRCNEKSGLLPPAKHFSVFDELVQEETSVENLSEEDMLDKERNDLIQDLVNSMYEEIFSEIDSDEPELENYSEENSDASRQEDIEYVDDFEMEQMQNSFTKSEDDD